MFPVYMKEFSLYIEREKFDISKKIDRLINFYQFHINNDDDGGGGYRYL